MNFDNIELKLWNMRKKFFWPLFIKPRYVNDVLQNISEIQDAGEYVRNKRQEYLKLRGSNGN